MEHVTRDKESQDILPTVEPSVREAILRFPYVEAEQEKLKVEPEEFKKARTRTRSHRQKRVGSLTGGGQGGLPNQRWPGRQDEPVKKASADGMLDDTAVRL
jgi:hypothetical protein